MEIVEDRGVRTQGLGRGADEGSGAVGDVIDFRGWD